MRPTEDAAFRLRNGLNDAQGKLCLLIFIIIIISTNKKYNSIKTSK